MTPDNPSICINGCHWLDLCSPQNHQSRFSRWLRAAEFPLATYGIAIRARIHNNIHAATVSQYASMAVINFIYAHYKDHPSRFSRWLQATERARISNKSQHSIVHIWPQTNVIITRPDQKERVSWWPRGVRENQKWVERRFTLDQFRVLPCLRSSERHPWLLKTGSTSAATTKIWWNIRWQVIYVVIGGADVCELESTYDRPEKAEKTRKRRPNNGQACQGFFLFFFLENAWFAIT
jgi:hypothetical protein